MKKLPVVCFLLAALLLMQGCGGSGQTSVSGAETTPAPGAVETAAPVSDTEGSNEGADNEDEAEEQSYAIPGVEPVFSAGGRDFEYVSGFFCSLALGEDEGATLHRWEGDIVCFADGSCSESDSSSIQAFADLIADIEGMPAFSIAEKKADANIVVHFCSRAELIELFGEAADYEELDSGISLKLSDSGAITGAEIYIRTDLFEYERDRLISKELLRALGLMYEAQLEGGSIFSTGEKALDNPSEFDLLMLKLLYNANLKTGMGKDDCGAYVKALLY